MDRVVQANDMMVTSYMSGYDQGRKDEMRTIIESFETFNPRQELTIEGFLLILHGLDVTKRDYEE